MITAHADGSCLGNPCPGGWAVVILDTDGTARTLTGSEPNTTNNRMELTAALMAPRALPADVPAVLFCDSEYVVKGLNMWLASWQRRGWKTARASPSPTPTSGASLARPRRLGPSWTSAGYAATTATP